MELEEKKAFTFMWKIENFSHCLQARNESLASPEFIIETLEESCWQISIYPNEENELLSYSIAYVDTENRDISVTYQLSLMYADGRIVNTEPTVLSTNEIGRLSVCSNLSLKEVYETIRSQYIFQDTLTLTCRFWKTDVDMDQNGCCFACTRIGIKKWSKLWGFDSFSNLLSFNRRSTPELSVTMNSSQRIEVRVYLRILLEKILQFQIQLESCTKPSLLSCKISVLGPSGEPVVELQDKHMFLPNEEAVWLFRDQIAYADLDEKKDDLVRQNILFFRFEFALSTGVEYEQIESTHYGLPTTPDMTSTTLLWNAISSPYNLPCTTVDLENKSSLKSDMMSLYQEKTFSDFNLKVENRTFPVHKSILCARSPVFKLILTSNTRKDDSKSLTVPDVDADTMTRMLLYVYTEVFDNMDLESALKLYYAADKYGILSLKRKCSLALKIFLTVANVSVILRFADKHQDDKLTSAIYDFIMCHDEEILQSAEWTEFDKSDFQLASKTMYMIYRKKLQL